MFVCKLFLKTIFKKSDFYAENEKLIGLAFEENHLQQEGEIQNLYI